MLSDLVKVDNLLLIIKNHGAISEIRSNSMSIRQKEKWITIGDNDGPAHMHIDSELIVSAEFVQEQKPERLSFSIRFYDEDENRILAVFFTKMYDDDDEKLLSSRKMIYDDLNQKYGSKIQL